jgi:hypothetical protein
MYDDELMISCAILSTTHSSRGSTGVPASIFSDFHPIFIGIAELS